MSSVAAIDIANLALIRLGENVITELSESTPLDKAYPFIRDSLLSWGKWTFATTRQSLSQHATAPASDYDHQYVLPTSPLCLRVLDVQLTAASKKYEYEVFIEPADPTVQTRVLLTDADSVVLRYIAQVSEHIWPPLVRNVLALWLAMDICMAITGKVSLRQQLQAELLLTLDRALTLDGHQDSPQQMALRNDYVTVRRGGAASTLITAVEEGL